MKKWGILIGGLILGFVWKVQAQTNMENLFSSSNENIIYSNQAKNYTGSPLIFIEGISDKPRPKDWRDEIRIKLFGSMDPPKKEIQKPLPPLKQNNVQNSVKVNPLFGPSKEVAFVPHTFDWNFIIQVLNDEEIIVQEDIQFIKTKDTNSLIRDWPKQDLRLLETMINGKIIPLSIIKEGEVLKLTIPELETGIHKIRLTYLIKKAGIFLNKSAKISLPLTATGWNLTTDSLNGIVLFPIPVQKANSTFLLGKNHQEIKEAFETTQDSSGNIFFRATHLMPANSAVQLNIDLKYDSFIRKGLWEKMTHSANFLIFVIALSIILLYLTLNIIEIKITPEIETLRLKAYLPTSNSFKNFLQRSGEIWIGLILLWGCTFGISYITNTTLSSLEIQILFLIPIVFVLIIDYLLLYPRQEKINKMRR